MAPGYSRARLGAHPTYLTVKHGDRDISPGTINYMVCIIMSRYYDIDALIGDTNLEARAYQKRVVNKACAMFQGALPGDGVACEISRGRDGNIYKSIGIVLPTGAGKTPVGLLIARIMQDITGCSVIWIAIHRTPLLQAKTTNEPRDVHNPAGMNIGANITFTSMFTRSLPPELLPARRGARKLLLVVDENQHDACDTCTSLHNALRPDYILGLSATPYRSDRAQLAFEGRISDIGIHELIVSGYLSPYDHYAIKDWQPLTVADTFLSNQELWGPTLIFFRTLDECKQCYHRLSTGGARFDIVTGMTDREAQLERFRAGELDGLINMMVLSEGLDIPDLKTVFTRDSGKGTTIQMAGRVFRKSKLYERKHIVQSVCTRYPIPLTVTPRCSWVWVNNSWASITPNEYVDRISSEVISILSDIPDDIPQQLRSRANTRASRTAYR